MVSHRHPLRDKLRFLGTFLKNPFRIGSMWPSSPQLAEAMVRDVQLHSGDVVVEDGPGTGPMTAALASCMPAGVHYLGIEHDEGFCKVLKERFPRLEFVRGSAEHVESFLSERGLPKARLIVSGLPFASMTHELQERIVGATKRALREDGVFRTFAYVHAYGSARARRFREFMAAHFKAFVRSKAVLFNVPPAYVLTYRHGSAPA